jgi:hypothetical protein
VRRVGGGILLLAAVAAIVAVLAYADSSRRPKLKTALEFRSLRTGELIPSHMIPRDEGVRGFTGDLPRPAAIGKLVPLEPVNLRVVITNSGEVAGKNVLVVYFLENVFFSPVRLVGPEWKLSPKVPGWQLQWEGGRPVFPGELPRGPSIDLTGM